VTARLVYYTFTSPTKRLDATRAWQIEASITSLRRHNATLPVVFCALGPLSARLQRLLARARVELLQGPAYEDELAALEPSIAPILARYPILHKWTRLRALPTRGVEQLLYVDTDTYFTADVARLFDKYARRDLYAREEVYSRRSQYGYRRDYLDQRELFSLARSVGARPVPPFNLGVVLMNHGVWRAIAKRLRFLLRATFRLLSWSVAHAPVGASAAIDRLREAREAIDVRARRTRYAPLPFPGTNYWTAEEIAFLLTLGTISALRQGDIERPDVLQGPEPTNDPSTDALVLHYYSGNTARFAAWLAGT